MSLFSTTTTLTAIACCKCGVTFGLDAAHETALRKSKELFYCPNGHSQYFAGKTETEKRAERAEAEAKRAKDEAAWANRRADNAEREAKVQKHRARGLKAHQTRLKKRIANGVCPCCHRTFMNLHRHMAGQHPTYGKAGDIATEPQP